jgi:acyl carrier protein
MDFLELFNKVARVVRPAHQGYVDITDMNQNLQESGLDSMDGLMMGIYFADIYAIPEEIAKEMHFTTVQECYDFIQKHKTKEPSGTAEEAIKGVDW